MNKILVAYATMSGSTAEVAQAVGEEIAAQGVQVAVLPLEQVNTLAGYDAIVLGAPMLMGWHPSALKFLAENRKALTRLPLAVFALGMSLSWRGEEAVQAIPLCVDKKAAQPPKKMGHPTLKERHSNVCHYAAPIIKAAAPARPVSIGFFGGKLDYARLNLFARLFVKLVIQAQPGDLRNWQAIRAWAGGLAGLLAA